MGIIALITVGGLLACDLNEGPREEAEEAMKAIQDGKSANKVQNQVEDIGQAMTERRSSLEKRLAKVDAWFDEKATELENSSEDAGEDVDQAMTDLGKRIEDLQTELSDTTHEIGDDVEKKIAKIEADMERPNKGDHQ